VRRGSIWRRCGSWSSKTTPTLGLALADGLRQAGHAVDWFRDGTQADAALSGAPFDAMVLDLGLPGTDGMGWLRLWRGRGVTLPVLILTARGWRRAAHCRPGRRR
jgi:DNA-binding response OmpR family regulator